MITELKEIDIDKIKPNKEQPRKKFSRENLDEMKLSIREHGIIQPIVVRNVEDEFEIIAGERRFRAAVEEGIKKVPCIIRNVKQIDSTKMALVENIQRENLNPIDEALAFKNLIEKHKMTQEEVADIIGKSRSYVSNSMRILKLSDGIIEMLQNGDISQGHARALLQIKDEYMQIEVALKVIEEEMSVRETEKYIKELTTENVENKDIDVDNSEFEYIKTQLMNKLGTKVNINQKKKKGKIEIEYYSREDLERILELLGMEDE